MDDKMKALLTDIENDNINELEKQTSMHRFGRSLDRYARAVCRGDEAVRPRRHALSVWAAVLIIILIAVLITGCAVTIYHCFNRYVPYHGIVEIDSNIKMYSSTESIFFGNTEVETLLYIDEGASGRLMIWASGKIPLSSNINELLSAPIFTVASEKYKYDLTFMCGSGDREGVYSQLEAGAVINTDGFDIEKLILEHKGIRKQVKLTDISYKGYSVSEWLEIKGITVKILPLYSNNGIVFTAASGKDGASISASYTVYDSLGNSVRGVGGSSIDGYVFVETLSKKLPGDVVRIDVESLRVRMSENISQTIPVPLDGERKDVDIPMISTELFDERIASVESKDGYIYVTSVTKPKTDITDISTAYNILGATEVESYAQSYERNKIITTAKIKMPSGSSEMYIDSIQYTYMICGDPLGTIVYRKEK